MQIRWITNTRRATQRLGFLKLMVSIAGPSRSRAEVSDELAQIVARRWSTPPEPDLAEWLQGLRGSIRSQQTSEALELEAQAYYIHRLPSRSGWLSPKGVEEYVEVLPRRLGLLDEVYRPTEIGSILRGVLNARDESSCWDAPCEDNNPLELTPQQRYFLAHWLIVADGDFLLPWAAEVLSSFGGSSFSYLDAGELVPDILARMATVFQAVAYLDSDRSQLHAIEAARTRIENEITVQIQKTGSGSRREQTVVPRLEWLVDLGMLARDRANGFSYRVTTVGQAAVTAAASAYSRALNSGYADGALQTVLDSHLARAFIPLLGDPKRVQTPKDIHEHLWPAYRAIDSISGYCLLRPLNVLANIESIRTGRAELTEYSEAVSLLEQRYRETPDDLHVTVDRLTTDHQVKLEPLSGMDLPIEASWAHAPSR